MNNVVTVTTDVEVDVGEVISQADDESLVEELKSRDFIVFSDIPDHDDPCFANEASERVLAIANLFKLGQREDGVKLIRAILARVFANL